ncbi:MAG: hypothetical protein EXS13_04465 [Planctomycetes bacterium]|nr:hypothetical protein [Planctomycetota bacterium]
MKLPRLIELLGIALVAFIALIVASDALGQATSRPKEPELWLYCSTNLQVTENVERVGALLDRAGAAGYTRMVLADSKLARLGTVPDHYFTDARRLIERARAAKIKLIPSIFGVGYSDAMLFHDPNLAEALPVRRARFVVQGDRAVADRRRVELRTPGWKDDLWRVVAGGFACRDPAGGNARVVFELELEPWQAYHVELTVATAEFVGVPEAKVLVGDRSLCFSYLGCKPTQDATRHHVVFHSQEHARAKLYVGAWGATAGELAIRDVAIEAAGLVNVVRREGAPIEIARASAPAAGAGEVQGGGAPLVEGVDFEPVVDPRSGQVPWPGGFEIWHEPPAIVLKRPLPEGSLLDVSFHSVVTVHDGQVTICPSEPRTMVLLADEVRRVRDLFGGDAFFLSHDEIRVWNQDESCRRRELDAGSLLADHLRGCIDLARAAAPKAELWIWSDMVDPHHNAHADYYLARGDFAGSWEGLAPEVGVACWYRERAAESLPFFAARGHPLLLAAYYDAPVEQVDAWLDAARDVPGVRAVMYTTWQSRYDELERFAQRVRAWK